MLGLKSFHGLIVWVELVRLNRRQLIRRNKGRLVGLNRGQRVELMLWYVAVHIVVNLVIRVLWMDPLHMIIRPYMLLRRELLLLDRLRFWLVLRVLRFLLFRLDAGCER